MLAWTATIAADAGRRARASSAASWTAEFSVVRDRLTGAALPGAQAYRCLAGLLQHYFGTRRPGQLPLECLLEPGQADSGSWPVLDPVRAQHLGSLGADRAHDIRGDAIEEGLDRLAYLQAGHARQSRLQLGVLRGV